MQIGNFYSQAQVARNLGVTQSTVLYHTLKRDVVPTLEIAGRRFFTLGDIEKFRSVLKRRGR